MHGTCDQAYRPNFIVTVRLNGYISSGEMHVVGKRDPHSPGGLKDRSHSQQKVLVCHPTMLGSLKWTLKSQIRDIEASLVQILHVR